MFTGPQMLLGVFGRIHHRLIEQWAVEEIAVVFRRSDHGVPSTQGQAIHRRADTPPLVSDAYVTTLTTSPVCGATTTRPRPMNMPT